MIFPTQYRSHIDFFSEVGSDEKITYVARYDENGVLGLIESGVINIYDEIQSHRDSVDIHVLMKLSETDPTVLTRAQGAYFDASDMPHTYADMLNLVIEAEDTFNRLSAEQKRNFNNSFSEFLAASGKANFVDLLGSFAAKDSVIKESDNSDEQK